MKHANDNHEITFVSMFSGIEAASVAFGPLGWKALAFAEIEKFPSAVLAHHYPDVPNVGDMTAHDWSQYRGKVDIVCGGPPCQAFSVAGLRNSMADARGNLSLSYMRALHAIKPRNAIVENVPGWLNTPDNAFGCFLAGLVGADAPLVSSLKRGRWPDAGMVAGPEGRAAWRILDAQYFGVPQRRRRVIVVADFGIGADPAEVLFEREGVQRHSPPSREAGQKPAPTISARTKGGGGLGTDFDLDGGLVETAVLRGHSDYGMPALRAKGGDCAGGSEALVYTPEIARCVATREGSSQDYETTTMVVGAICKDSFSGGAGGRPEGAAAGHFLAVSVTGDVAHTLKAEGADASEDGTGRGTPIVCFVQNSRDEVRLMGGDGQIVAALAAEPGAKQQRYVATPEIRAFQSSQSGVRVDDVHATLDSNNGSRRHNGALVGSAVRRLTPVECERLQGFPDNWTQIPWRGKPADQCPDGPRYKALGNSWAVPKFAWLGRRIAALMPAVPAVSPCANDNKDTRHKAA